LFRLPAPTLPAAALIILLLIATPGLGQAPRRVAFTYDDLPANIFRGDVSAMREVTDGLLAGLRRHRIPAIGFVNESKLFDDETLDEERVALLRAWLEGGQELGNHSFSHPDINTTPLEEYQADVLEGERVTRALLADAGRELRYFRHPMLHTGLDLETKSAFERFLGEHGYRIAPVTIDNQEWIFARAYDHAHVRGDVDLKQRIATEYVVYMDSIFGYYEQQSRALLGYELPQVLLLHANRLNADAMDALVSAIRARGYDFVTLDEALEDEAYRLPDEYVGRAGITWLHRWALARGERGEFFAGEPDIPAFVREAYDSPPDR
jgi:peptidoglycan/xylan/chitin deacetylase (PgdA/CDA1 family)